LELRILHVAKYILPNFLRRSIAGRVIFYWFRLVYRMFSVKILSQNQIPVIVVAFAGENLIGDHNVRKS
jgi:hypothetical protein